jgi:nucleoside-triphosphatase
MNILLTGSPGCGKTTLLKRLAKELEHFQPVGFYSQEIREEGVRKGFGLTSLDGHFFWHKIIFGLKLFQ